MELKMERIPFVAMKNGKIIVIARIFIDTFWHYIENMSRTFESYADTWKIAAPILSDDSNDFRSCGLDITARSGNQRFYSSQSRFYLSCRRVASICRFRSKSHPTAIVIPRRRPDAPERPERARSERRGESGNERSRVRRNYTAKLRSDKSARINRYVVTK